MKVGLRESALLAILAAALSGCGGGGGGSGSTPTSSGWTSSSVPQVSFQAVTVHSPPVVSFSVKDASGNAIKGLKTYQTGYDGHCGSSKNNYTSNLSVAIAKYVNGSWQNLISLERSSNNPYNAIEGTTDPIHGTTAAGVGTLSQDASTGVYTYTFGTDVTNPAYSTDTANTAGTIMTNGQVAVLDGQTVHRIALQLCYVDPGSGATVKVNPYIDFTLDANGTGVPFKNAQNTLKPAVQVVDRASCNECHVNFAWHGGNRVDPQFCVMCHNPGSTDYATGNPIDFRLMIHKFHMGKLLTHAYTVQSDSANAIIYPQDQRNCVKCHTGTTSSDPNVAVVTAQGDNWQSKAGKNACWACHDDYKDAGSNWQTAHSQFATLGIFLPSVTDPDDTPDYTCQGCHNPTGAGTIPSIAKSHQIPEWVLSENYRFNIWNISKNGDNSLTVEYSVSNPKTGTDYDLTSDTTKFGDLSILFGWNTTDYSNDGGPGRGQPFSIEAATDASVQRVGTSNHFTLNSGVMPAAATGTVAVAFQGRINDSSGLRVPVPNLVKYYAMNGGTILPRRQVVSADKCNACHGRFLGFTSLTSFKPGLGAHGAKRNDTQVCVICHNGNNLQDGTVVSGGVVTQYAESADFKQMIHKMHEAVGNDYPAWPYQQVTTTQGATINAGLRYCNVCHVDKSYVVGSSVLGTSLALDVDTSVDSTNATITDTNSLDNPVITPKASACYSCHSSDEAMTHMIQEGGAAFSTVVTQPDGTVTGSVTQGAVMNGTAGLETCDACHDTGAFEPVDVVHLGTAN
jgi:OmcA/MtrC family decaheme c-type cytochrome